MHKPCSSPPTHIHTRLKRLNAMRSVTLYNRNGSFRPLCIWEYNRIGSVVEIIKRPGEKVAVLQEKTFLICVALCLVLFSVVSRHRCASTGSGSGWVRGINRTTAVLCSEELVFSFKRSLRMYFLWFASAQTRVLRSLESVARDWKKWGMYDFVGFEI